MSAVLAETVDRILDRQLQPEPAPSEDAWHSIWISRALGGGAPIVTAVTGGALADRLAWVFLSGYQAAVRRAFPELASSSGWACLAASEDREGKLPGATLAEQNGHLELSGTKTWIAASDHVAQLVVTAGSGAEPRIVAVDRDSAGVTVESYDRAGFLGDMTQGRATFDGATVAQEFAVPSEGRGFGAAEPLHVLTALNAFVLSHALALAGPASLVGQTLAAIHGASVLAERALTSDAMALGLAGLDAQTQTSAAEFEALIEEVEPELHQRWSADRRLLGMFSAGIGKHAEAAAARATGH